MEEIKVPKKERKFLKAIGNIGKVLVEELVMGIARKFIGKAIDKVGNKKQGLVIAFIVLASSFAFAQFPTNTNKQRLGFQTTGDGLTWRGSISDTASIQPINNQNAWIILDTVNLKIYSFDFTSNVWNQVGGSAFAQPIDSLFFKTSVPANNVDTAKMRWDNELGTVVLGMYDAVPNELGFKNFWLVKNQTGSTITKNSLVYASGTVGSSGRISVSKFIANGTIDAKYLLGITAHDLSDGEDGYVISFGKIRQVNTDTFAAGAILYPSPTTAGVWTDIEPVAPNIDLPIGFCINSSSNNGTIAIRVASGYKLNELHDLAISSPVTNASLYYSGGLWRDTTPTLLVSDTAAMLANYATKAYADTSGRFYARQDFTNVSSSTLTWTQSDTLVVGGVNVVQVYRNGQILLPTQYTIPTNASVVIGATAYKVGENYTVIFPRGGGGGSGSGSGSLTSISGGTGILVSPNPITTTGTVSADLSVLMELTDTSLLNLTTRFASKLNTTDTASLSSRINAKGNGTVTSVATGYGLTGGTITTTGTLVLDSAVIFSRIRDSIVDVAIGNDTIKILKQEYAPATTSVLTWTITPKFPIQLKQYILVFRNGQLLINDQYNLTDTNKITIVSTSFKVGANYTVATVSGIGSINTGVFPNPIYPDAGIALSTGSTWASSIPNNSSNWNTAFTDRLKWDGGSTDLIASTGRTSLGGTIIGQSMFTLTNPSAITFPRFNVDNTVSALTAANFRSAIGAGTVTTVNASSTSGNPISIDNNTTTPTIELLSATSARNGYLTSTDWTTFNNKQASLGFTPANSTITVATTAPLQGGGNLTANRTLSITQATTSADGFLTSTDWNTFNGKQNTLISGTTIKTVNGTTLLGSGNLSVGTLVSTDTIILSNRINLKVNISDTASMLNPYFRDADTSLLNLTNRFNSKLNISDTLNMLTPYLRKLDTTLMLLPYLRKADTTSMLLPYFKKADTTLLNLTSRFAAKQNNITLTTTGTSGLATFNGTTLNIPNYTASGGTGTVTSVGLTAPSIFNVSGSPVTTSGTLALTYSGTALPLLNGGTGATTADGALTNLGATAQGKLLFGLSNSTSDKFIKVNTDNTITLLNAADTRSAIGAGVGTVTNVSGTGAVSVSNGTTTPSISVASAAFGTAGIVTATGTQQFSGDKTFEGIVQFNARAVFKDYTYQATRLAGLSSTDRLSTVTLGTGLTLSSGVLSATAGVTSVTASTPIASSGGATPNITITDAGASASGVVNTTTQSFAGNKTFTGNVVMQNDIDNREGYIRRKYVAGSAATYIVLENDTWIRWGRSDLVTFTLPSAADFPGREIHILNIGNSSITSNATNIQQLDGSQNSQITGAGPGKWCTLVSTGATYWQKMAGN